MSVHHPDMEYSWVRSIPQIEEAIWQTIEIEDFHGNAQLFKLEKYQTDRMFLKVLVWDSKGAIIEIDLGTNSNIPSPVRIIKNKNWEIIFTQTQEIDTYLDWKWEIERYPMDVDVILSTEREYYRKMLSQIPKESIQWSDVNVFVEQLTTKWLFTAEQVREILWVKK